VGPKILDSSGIFRDVDEGRVSGIFRDEDDSGKSASGTNALLPPSRALRRELSPRPIKTVSNKYFLRSRQGLLHVDNSSYERYCYN